jgi:hypothetical protein
MQLNLPMGNVVPFKPRTKSVIARIADMTAEPAGPNGCRVFTGSYKQSNGRPQIKVKSPITGKPTSKDAARCVLEADIGRVLQPHELSLHMVGCLPGCCTHGHLRVGTHKENAADRKADGRKVVRLKPRQALAIVRGAEKLSKAGKSRNDVLATLSKRYGVTTQTINNILRGRRHAKTTGIEHVILAPGCPAKGKAKVLKFPRQPAKEVRISA